jgi:hypothetical protein
VEEIMSDLYDQVTDDQDIFKKIMSKVPGFSGYIERQNRRAADKLLREAVADSFDKLWTRISDIQADLTSSGDISIIDELETATTKLRTFIDKVRTASYGYSGFFDAVKINEEELAQLYQFDAALLDLGEEVSRAIDNLEASIGTDGLPAAVRNLVTQARQCVETFESREEVFKAEG